MRTDVRMPVLGDVLPDPVRAPGCCGFADEDGSPCATRAVDRLSLHLESADGSVLEVILDDVEVCDHHFQRVTTELAATYPFD